MPHTPTRTSVVGHAPSAARSSNGSSSTFTVPPNVDTIAVHVNVTAAGTTFLPFVEWSIDGATWAAADPADVFTAITATGSKVKAFAVKAPNMRVSWSTFTGTFTFSVDLVYLSASP